jgi:hypothetical protein
MLGLVPIVLLAATFCGGFYFWLSRRGLAAEERANPQDRRRVSLLTESVAYFGATLVLAGGGVAVGQAWGDFTDWGHVGIFASTALFFLTTGLAVLRVSEPAIQRMIGVVWFVSTAATGAAAGIAAEAVFGASGPVTTLVIGLTITVYSAMLWLTHSRELQMVTLFTGVTIAVCALIITIAGDAGPRLAIALGLWALGIGWVIVGWKYPQPLWSTVPLATVIALIGPSLAVWSHGWVFAIGITTAAAAMAASVWVRNTTLLAAGTLALFGYVSAVVVRYYQQSLGIPATLAVCGVLLLTLAVIMARVRRGTRRQLAEAAAEAGAPARLHPAKREPGRLQTEPGALAPEPVEPEPELIESGPGAFEPGTEPIEPEPEHENEPARAMIAHTRRSSDSPTLHLPKAS